MIFPRRASERKIWRSESPPRSKRSYPLRTGEIIFVETWIHKKSRNVFTTRENCDIMNLPNKKLIMFYGECPIFIWGFMPFWFFLHKSVNNGKNVDSADLCMVFSVSLVFCLATIGVGVFRCASFGWRTFLF